MAQSRGARESVSSSAILSKSMRDNYETHGVEEYYKRVAKSYRNPHMPGIRSSLRTLLDKWYAAVETENVGLEEASLFDLACGSGESSLVFVEWCSQNKKKLVPKVYASDPYTAPAYEERTSHTCSSLSFRDIANGEFPPLSRRIRDHDTTEDGFAVQPSEIAIVDITICSFALHLVETPSELFSLLWQLSIRSKWLIVLAPHKKPDIKAGWGWTKWDIDDWTECDMNAHKGELLRDRVHCRLYKSVNI